MAGRFRKNAKAIRWWPEEAGWTHADVDANKRFPFVYRCLCFIRYTLVREARIKKMDRIEQLFPSLFHKPVHVTMAPSPFHKGGRKLYIKNPINDDDDPTWEDVVRLIDGP